MLWLCLFGAGSLAAGTVLPPGFSEVQIADVANGTAMAIAPDGRIFVCEKAGSLRVIKNDALLPTPFMTLTVDSAGERGLIGICLDPAFASNNHLYVYYTVPGTPAHNRVSRFTANGDVVLGGSELILTELDNLSAATNHNGGAMHFGPDGKLYVAVGENATTSHAQTLANRHGKILRINADALNSIPTDNPFYGTATGLNRSIWALGLRNPFTFNFHRTSGRMFINDVGGNGVNTTEEVNDGISGANYGWSLTEGDFVQASFPAFTRPFHAYNSGMTTDCAIIGASFYDPPVAQFPAAYQDQYFFGDYCGAWIKTLDPSTPMPLTTTVGATFFATGTGMLVDLAVDRNNGTLVYYRANGQVVRVSYTGSLAPYIGLEPESLTVTAGSSAQFCVSAGGSPLPTLQWQRNGVDIVGATSTCYTQSPALLGDHNAQFRAVASNVNGSVTSTAAILYVTANNAPSPTILSPTAGLLYSAGQSYSLLGSATDAEDGALGAASLSWTVVFHHGSHTHPFFGPVTGSGATIDIPNQGETATDVWFRVHLSAVDSFGLTSTVQRDIQPNLVTFTVQSAPVPLSITVDGITLSSPQSVLSVNGMLRELGAPGPQAGYSFSNWSDALGQTHFITASAGASFTANYVAFTPTVTPSASPSGTASPSPTSSGTSSPTSTPTVSASPTATPSATLTAVFNTQTNTPSASPSPSPGPSATINDLGFSWTPSALTISAGTTVNWVWAGTHDVRSDTSLFSSGAFTTGGSFSFTFNTPGTYRYYCSLHGGPGGSGMAGIIYVQGPATPTPSASPTATATPSASPTRSPSPSVSPSVTDGPSATPSPVLSPTHIPTLTPSFSATRSSTASPTPSFSATQTPSATVTPDFSATLAPSAVIPGGPLVIFEAQVWPQPNPRFLSLNLNGPADQVRLQLYSTALNATQIVDLGPAPAGWSRLMLPPQWHLGQANGLYHARVEAQRDEKISPPVKVLKLVLLR